MRATVSVSLPEDLRKELDEFVEQEGMSRSDLVRRALQDFLFARRLEALRARMMVQAQAQGVFTDEDVFERIS